MTTTDMLKKELSAGHLGGAVMYCFQTRCPKTQTCIHFQSYLLKNSRTTCGMCVFPLSAGQGDCPHYAPLRMVRVAWGFDRLFDELKAKDAPRLRAGMKMILGSKGQYYRYKLGQLKLSPEQQTDILRLFARSGYAHVAFDHYEEVLDVSRLSH